MSKLALPLTLRETWGTWLAGQPWDLFVTLTSEKQTHPEAMFKRFRYCMHKASDHVYGRNWDRRQAGTQWVVGLERTKQGWPHCHAVVAFPGVDIRGQAGRQVFDLAYWQAWMTDTGGFAWLQIPRSEAAVVSYVTKYVTKDGDLELSPNVEFASSSGDQLLLLRRATPRARPSPPASESAAAMPGPWDDLGNQAS
jgi:hypothetical protein